MRLKPFRHLWGIAKPFSEVAPLIKANGYDGIEQKEERAAANDAFKPLLNRYGFEFIAQLHTLPFTNEPVSDLQEICGWMARRQKEAFHQFINTKAHVANN